MMKQLFLLWLGVALTCSAQGAESTNASVAKSLSVAVTNALPTNPLPTKVEISVPDELVKLLTPPPQPWWSRNLVSAIVLAVFGFLIWRAQKRIEDSITKSQLVSKLRYETELAAYREIWKGVVEFVRAVASLTDPRLTNEQKNSALQSAANTFWDAIEYNRPFYPPELWAKIETLETFCRKLKNEFLANTLSQATSVTEVQKKLATDRDELERLARNIEDVIRKRLLKFDEVKSLAS